MFEPWISRGSYCEEHETYKNDDIVCECWALAESEYEERQFDQWIEDRAFGNV